MSTRLSTLKNSWMSSSVAKEAYTAFGGISFCDSRARRRAYHHVRPENVTAKMLQRALHLRTGQIIVLHPLREDPHDRTGVLRKDPEKAALLCTNGRFHGLEDATLYSLSSNCVRQTGVQSDELPEGTCFCSARHRCSLQQSLENAMRTHIPLTTLELSQLSSFNDEALVHVLSHKKRLRRLVLFSLPLVTDKALEEVSVTAAFEHIETLTLGDMSGISAVFAHRMCTRPLRMLAEMYLFSISSWPSSAISKLIEKRSRTSKGLCREDELWRQGSQVACRARPILLISQPARSSKQRPHVTPPELMQSLRANPLTPLFGRVAMSMLSMSRKRYSAVVLPSRHPSATLKKGTSCTTVL